MKHILLTLLTAMSCLTAGAQAYLWHDGIHEVEYPDSITFPVIYADTATTGTDGNYNFNFIKYAQAADIEWSECNLGATRPEDSGYYMATHIYRDTVYWRGTPYVRKHYVRHFYKVLHTPSGDRILAVPDNDPLIANLGKLYRLPTANEISGFASGRNWTPEERNGVNGLAASWAFVPQAGRFYGGRLLNKGNTGFLASDSAGFCGYFSDAVDNALRVGSTTLDSETGMNVRVVRPVAKFDSAKVVDLGLSVKWASRYIGTSQKKVVRAWGDPREKLVYDDDDYLYYHSVTGADGNTTYLPTKYATAASPGYDGHVDSLTVLQPKDDPATVLLGEPWRTPTWEEWRELREKCTWEEGYDSYTVTGPNGNSIEVSKNDWGHCDSYWTSTLNPDDSGKAAYFYYGTGWVEYPDEIYYERRSSALPIHPVCP